MGKINIQEVEALRNSLKTNLGFVNREYKNKTSSINSKMSSVISSYAEYSDVTSKAREIQRIIADIKREASNLEKMTSKITDGLKGITGSVKSEERESMAIIRTNKAKITPTKVRDKNIAVRSTNFSGMVSKESMASNLKMSEGMIIRREEDTRKYVEKLNEQEKNILIKVLESVFNSEEIKQLALLCETANRAIEQQRGEELKKLQGRLAQSDMTPLSTEEIAFYDQLPKILKEKGINLLPEEQRALMACLHIKGNVETIDLKRFGVSEDQNLEQLSKEITLAYDSEYYKVKNNEKMKENLGLLGSFLNDTIVSFDNHVFSLAEAAVNTCEGMVEGVYRLAIEPPARMLDLFICWNGACIGTVSPEEFDKKFNEYCDYGEALTNGMSETILNVFNLDLSKNTLLSPIWNTIKSIPDYITGNMDRDQQVEYYQNLIQSVLFFEGAVKAVKAGVNFVKGKMSTQAVGTEVVENLSDDIAKFAKQYGDDVTELFEKYGDDAARLLKENAKYIEQYGSDGLRVIKEYGDDACRVIEKGLSPETIRNLEESGVKIADYDKLKIVDEESARTYIKGVSKSEIEFFKKGGGSNLDDFMTPHSEKHAFNPNTVSSRNKTQFGENIDVAKLREDTMLHPDKVIYDSEHNIIKYEKEYDFNISTPDTPTGSHRVFICLDSKPGKTNRSSQFPYYGGKK